MSYALLQLDTPLDRDRGDLSRQVARQIRRAIDAGALKPGDRLPASRQLAADLGVARGTVTAALDRLTAEGLLVARRGAGTFVSADVLPAASETMSRARRTPVVPRRVLVPDVDPRLDVRIDLRPCRPSLEAFPLATWRRCLSRGSIPLPSSDYGDPRGCLQLRREIASYLRRARGLKATHRQIIMTNGSVHAMHLLAMVMLEPSRSSGVVMEDPGYPLAAQAFELAGGHLHYCPVDEDGLRLEDLPGAGARLVYVTPSHQFPTGARLSLARRQELIRWAQHHGALIVEDDYDGEFRYDVAPLAPLAALAPEVVVYCGTFSKTLFPDLRLGFAVAPEGMIDAMASLRTVTEYAPPMISQAALRHFLADGHFERHVQRMRRIYSAKRQRLAELLTETHSGAQLSGLDSGLNAVVDLQGTVPAEVMARRAAEQGVALHAISRYGSPAAPPRNALILGYAAPSEAELEQVVTGLAEGWRG